jgi:hypothetical protein
MQSAFCVSDRRLLHTPGELSSRKSANVHIREDNAARLKSFPSSTELEGPVFKYKYYGSLGTPKRGPRCDIRR